VLHPRLWRTVRDLPENTQGKVPLDSLAQLFQELDWEGPAADRPEVLEEFRGRSSLERLCLVPRDLSCFPGHFPDLPVVPGVLQLDWAMELVAELLDATPRIEAIESLKLLAPLEPGGRFRIRVRVTPEARVDLKIWSEGAEHARGRVRLDAAGRQDT
jgi:3-hydroxymyristoyl/3-hydroxydecanoyl-(acyl carrier protein) dehydratase